MNRLRDPEQFSKLPAVTMIAFAKCFLLVTAVQAFTVTTELASRRPSRLALGMSSQNSDEKRVVVTGLGVISGCGIGAESFFQACLDGKSSIRRVQRFDVSYMPCQIASEVPEEMFDPNDYFSNPKNAKSNDRFTHFAVAAAKQALQDAQLGNTPETLDNPGRVGVIVGSAFGGMETFEQETIKLSKKPERPKVRSYCADNLHIMSHVVPHYDVVAFTGFTIYNPCPAG